MNVRINMGLRLILLALGIFFSSCERYEEFDDRGQGQPKVVALNVGITRASDPGSPADNDLNSLRVLLYNSGSGSLEYNIPISTVTNPVKLDILTGTYDFVFIANEDSDSALKDKLTSVDNADIDYIDEMRALTFAREAFDAGKAIPMASFIEQVQVFSENTIQTPSMPTPVTGTWDVEIVRAAIRLRMEITMTESLFDRWEPSKVITIGNIPDYDYLLPRIDNSAAQNRPEETFAAGIASEAGLISNVDTDGNITVTYDRLIMPELFLSQANNTVDHSMVLSMDFGDKIKSTAVRIPEEHGMGYALVRNTFLEMLIAVNEYGMVVEAEIVPWGDASRDTPFNGQYSLTVDKSEYSFNSHSGSQPIGITTDYSDGWTVDGTGSEWLILPTVDDNAVCVQEYTGTTPRTGTFTVKAGALTKIVHVTQFPPVAAITDAVIPNSYIGAFWRADQFGERLIRTTSGADDGDWVAIVAEGEDWIHLDTRMTSDPNVGWLAGSDEDAVKNGNDPGFDDMYSVSDNLKSVSGRVSADNPEIYFRIGLNSQYTPTDAAPARYGVVLLSYAGNTKIQRIWIRQGENADYLMRYGDPISGTSGVLSRDHAVQFMPYNLTADTLNAQVYKQGTKTEGTTASKFTDYPTQTGALFQWMDNVNPRYAWDPYTTAIPAGWDNVEDYDLWSNIKSDFETCPVGYRRPTMGYTDRFSLQELDLSEMNQSLFVEISAGIMSSVNNSYGYYADGFFDRHAIGFDPTGLMAGTTVSRTNRDIAFVGQLFYNAANFASIFFPVTNSRNENEAFSPMLGVPAGFYWSSSSGATYSTGMVMSNLIISGYSAQSRYGFNIRCVKDTE